MKDLIRKYFSNFVFFYQYIGYRIFVTVGLNMLVGIMDGFGLAMFLPLLQLVDGKDAVNQEKMGKLSFIIEGFATVGLPLNLVTVLLFLCFFFLLKGLFRYFASMYGVIVRQFFVRTLRIQLINGLNQISYKFFMGSDAGRIQNTITGEANSVSVAFNNYFKSLEQLVLVLVYMSFAFFVDIRFALLVTIGGLLTNQIYSRIYKRTKKLSRKTTKKGHRLQSLIIQHVANYKYLKGTGYMEKFGEQLKLIINRLELDKRQIGFYNAIVNAMREPVLIVVITIVILVQVNGFKSPLGPILISLLFFYRALSALMSMQSSWNTFLSVSGSMDNMNSFLSELRLNKEKRGKLDFLTLSKGLQLDSVSVTFGSKTILEEINVKFEKNRTVAFVGESGSGKTTLVNIISGIIPPDRGVFLIDDVSSKQVDILKYQQRLGFITQEPVIFNDTIFNNVTFWDNPTEENKERFWRSLELASIDSFVRECHEREHSKLGHQGINLSGGQRQRISIARELYKDIDILIMDEATSALDSETEKTIQDSIDQLKGAYTIFIVAHRFSTIKNADQIIVLDKGKIISMGTFSALMEKSPVFKSMVELQELS